MNDDFPTIDALARRLVELGVLDKSEMDEFKRLEMSSMISARKEDAMMLYSRLPDNDPAKEAMNKGLADLRCWINERLKISKKSNPPKLLFVSGAPGSGKSCALHQWAKDNPEALIASADDFKARFKSQLAIHIGNTPEPTRSNLTRSVYIHRLTAMPSWEMVDLAIDEGKDLAVEMLGMAAAEDARTLRRAIAKGYEVEVWHVGCSVEQSSARAAKRYFDQKKQGQDRRWIGLAVSAGKQKTIVNSFAQLCELMKGTPAKMKLFDNTGSEMKMIWSSDESATPPVENFVSWHNDPKLWRPGANPAADLCAFALSEEGTWKVALIERAHEPFKGSWSFPGGFVKGVHFEGEFEWGPEAAKQAAMRRFEEETLASPGTGDLSVDFVGKFDDLDRDPRNTQHRWVESWLFTTQLKEEIILSGGDAASSAKWVDLNDIFSDKVPMAFDHKKLIEYALIKISKKDVNVNRKSKNSIK